mmetsp:Transcript_40658/g.61994  ORF Transcript_40658/g.61994 Transcript_40658/m.61994 type:complete len:120 (+) Transcript_40658:429-788(+)
MEPLLFGEEAGSNFNFYMLSDVMLVENLYSMARLVTQEIATAEEGRASPSGLLSAYRWQEYGELLSDLVYSERLVNGLSTPCRRNSLIGSNGQPVEYAFNPGQDLVVLTQMAEIFSIIS